MKPAPFDYHAPTTVEQALTLLAECGDDAMVLAGGQTLTPLLNMRLARPSALIDLNRIESLFGIWESGNELRIGAMTRHLTLEKSPLIRLRIPLLSEAAQNIAHLQIRTRGTIGGSLANAAAASEWCAAVAALDGLLVVRSISAERKLTTDEFFDGAMRNTLDPEEILTEIRVPVPERGTGWAFIESSRRHGDFALAGAAVLVSSSDDGSIGSVKLAMCGMAEPGQRLRDVEAALVGAAPDATTFARVALLVSEAVDAAGDYQISEASRRHIAGAIAARAFSQAVARAQKSPQRGR